MKEYIIYKLKERKDRRTDSLTWILIKWKKLVEKEKLKHHIFIQKFFCL